MQASKWHWTTHQWQWFLHKQWPLHGKSLSQGRRVRWNIFVISFKALCASKALARPLCSTSVEGKWTVFQLKNVTVGTAKASGIAPVCSCYATMVPSKGWWKTPRHSKGNLGMMPRIITPHSTSTSYWCVFSAKWKCSTSLQLWIQKQGCLSPRSSQRKTAAFLPVFQLAVQWQTSTVI